MYLAGSMALGAYQQGTSDVDVAIVVDDHLTRTDKQQLVDRLRHESLACPARGLELVVYRLVVARSGTSDPGFEVELNSGRSMSFRATYDPGDRPAEDGRFWYAVDRSILREHGVALLGPPAAEVFGKVDDLRSLLAESVRWHLEHGAAQDGALGACRALIRVRTGRWVSKVEASAELDRRAPVDAREFQQEVLRELSPPSGPDP